MEKQQPKPRLELNDKIVMCSGVGCPMRGRCYRYRLDYFYGFIAKEQHPNPKWIEPAYDKHTDRCPFYTKVKFKDMTSE